MKTILVPLDGSACAEQVLPYVRLLARLLDARVHLFHVLTDVDREGMIVSGVVVPEASEENTAPERAIDRRACVPECPTEAIFPEDQVPAEYAADIEANRRFFSDGPGYWDFDLEHERVRSGPVSRR